MKNDWVRKLTSQKFCAATACTGREDIDGANEALTGRNGIHD